MSCRPPAPEGPSAPDAATPPRVDFTAIRSRLAGSGGRLYWRSLGEAADTPEFREYLHREFPEQASEWNDPKGRRDFLKLMSASLALAGVGACTRQPPESIVPYVRQPEEIVPGRPLFFASAVTVAGVAQPVLVESHMGRPTKVEGNPEHPASLGATDAITQAALLDLYDPDRAQTVTYRGEVRPWGTFLSAVQNALNAQRARAGAGLRFLTPPITSPSLGEIVATIQRDFPQARWHVYDPVDRPAAAASGAYPVYHFDRADVIVSLDADFLGCAPGHVRYIRDFSERRRLLDDRRTMNRLYVVESTPTLTGGKADHRLPVAASDVESFARALAAAVGAAGGGSVPAAAAPAGSAGVDHSRWVNAIAKDLQAHRGRSVVVAGEFQSPAVQALAQAMNGALGNTGTTVTYSAGIEVPIAGAATIAELAQAMDGSAVELLVMLGGNPAFTAPADLQFAERLSKVGLAIYHGPHADETAYLSHWHIPEAHAFETWGDARAYDGTVTISQPLIAPLYEVRSAHEVLGAFTPQRDRRTLDIIRDYWSRAHGGGTGGWTLRDAQGEPFRNTETFWRRAVHDGFIGGTALAAASADATAAVPEPGPAQAPAAAAQTAPPPSAATAAPQTGLEIIFRPDPRVWDGRFANNGWLQELPKPLSKVTWDTTAWIAPRLAEEHGLRTGDVVELKYRGASARMPVFILPGHPASSVTVFFGYGRRKAGRVGNAIGEAEAFNPFLLRTSDAPWFGRGLEIARTGEHYPIAYTQEHQAMEGRAPVRTATLDAYNANPALIHAMGHTPPRTLTLYPEHEYNGHKWGMAIDLTACTGCGACTVACVAENNIPVVGKEEVRKNREMHWIRVDHYFAGEFDNPQVYHQPVPCMQCEQAPCEVVCPVAATAHSAEGLNDMVYNRCVGTRYCSNNCPYKVRRFNFLLYADWDTESLYPLRNPDVTVRSRGVMEKCTYCVQRINHARIDAKRQDRAIRDGEVVTACQGVCPANAIVFGDMNDPASQVNKLKAQARNYGLLEELNTRPRTTYLAAIRNPNPELEPAQAAGGPTGH